MLKKLLIIFLVFLSVILFYLKFDNFNRISFDYLYVNNSVNSFTDAASILKNYRLVTYANLPLNIKNNFKSGLEYFEIPVRDLQKKIILNQRLYSLLTPSQQKNEAWFIANGYVYLTVDILLIKKMFELIASLNTRGYNANEIKITYCHRSISDNDKVRGAISSMHLWGKAFDISVGDVNSDKAINIKDKDIVYNMLDKLVINNIGGVGYYPFSKTALHFDVRGKRARWDQYKRK